MLNIQTKRIDENRLLLSDGGDFSITLFANEQVQIDRQSVAETANLFGINHTLKKLNEVSFFGDVQGQLNNCILTPDFHKGAGIPVGTVMETTGLVLPRSAGTDIGCVDFETEYLTPKGWKRICDYNDELIMQYDPETGIGSFTKPNAYIKLPCSEFYWFKTKYGVNQMLSAEHRILCWHNNKKMIFNAADLASNHNRLVLGSKVKFETTFIPEITTSIPLSDEQLRVQIMVLADGTLRSNGRADVTLKKMKKIERCRFLLNKANISFYEWHMKSGATTISFIPPLFTKECDELWQASLNQLCIISDECLLWDGNTNEKCFYTRNKSIADFIHYAFSATGKRGVMREDKHKHGSIDYRVFANENTRIGIAGFPKTPVVTVPSIDGFKYCFTVPTGFWVMRRGGNIVMTGNCGMRLVIASITKDEFLSLSKTIDDELRHAFFEGGRDIPMSEEGRASMLREGMPGLQFLDSGIWKQLDKQKLEDEMKRMHRNGSWKTNDVWNFQDYIRGSGGISRDAAIASIGGGNHFVEIQYVDECIDKSTCYNWGIKKGYISIMAHTGSVSFGSSIGIFFMDLAKKLFPHNLDHPFHGFYPLPTVGKLSENGKKYLSAMGLAANFAIINRLMLTELVLQCLSKVIGKQVEGHLVYDAPHNLVWSDEDCCKHTHRKGATPSEFIEYDEQFPMGHPVIVPGSMGDASYVLRGKGNIASLCSAPHGAGRITARGEGRKGKIEEIDQIRIVTKIDPKKTRRDVANELFKTLLEEAPSNYKDITPVIETVKNADIAEPVAKLMPLLTIKG